MIPDVNLKTYYLQFISNASSDIVKYKENLSQTIKIKEDLYNYINDNINIINKSYSIDLRFYTNEWVNKEYSEREVLYNKIIKLINVVKEDDVNKITLYQIVKYCNTLSAENKYNQLINLATTRKTMKFRVYTKYVMDYYFKVQKTALQGMGYHYSNGIGTYCINHWKIELSKMSKTKRIDFAATNIKKRELLAKGEKLYDDKEATWYKARNIPYTAIDYRVYKNENSFYDFTFIKSELFNNKTLDYKRIEYVSHRYRGLTYVQMSHKYCKTTEDIYNLQVDIKYKLNILLYQDPTKYLNFIRNAEQCKYKRGAHNS